MSENQNTQQKYFLDLGGLTTLWSKIKSSFADKTQTEESINNINISLGDLDLQIKTVDNNVDNLENTVLTFAPREVNYHADAIEASKSVAAGTLIKVLSADTSAEDPTPSGYSTGIYVVVGSGEIQYISTSDGNSDASDITALGERVESLEETVVKSAEIVDENGNQLRQSYSVANNVLLVAHDDQFDIDSDSVKALTHRAVAAKIRNIESAITQIPKFKISVVDELPTEFISLSTIYLLRNTDTYTNNLFTEYIYVERVKDDPNTPENESKFVWEKLGEQTLVVDDIVTTDQLNQALSIALANYAKTADVESMISEASQNIKTEIYADIESTYATKAEVEEISKDIEDITGELDNYLTKHDAETNYLTIANAQNTYLAIDDAEAKGWMNESEIITSVQFGNIGSAIRINDEQIEEMIVNNQ